MKNSLYTKCEGFLGKTLTEEDNQFYLTFGISCNILEDEVKEIKRNDINNLYFNVVESVISREMCEDLYDLRSFIRAVDMVGTNREKIENIIDAIYNGNEYKRR